MSEIMSTEDAKNLKEVTVAPEKPIAQEPEEAPEPEPIEEEIPEETVVPEAEADGDPKDEVEIKPEEEEPSTGIDKRLAKLLAERKQLKAKVEELEIQSIPQVKGGELSLDPNDFQDLESYKAAYAQAKSLKFVREQRLLVDQHPEIRELVEDDANRNRLGFKTANESMIQLIQESPIGAQVWSYLLHEPEEAMRIARLSPLATAREMGKIELLIENEPKPEAKPAKPVQKLPEPPKPVKANKPAAAPSSKLASRFVAY